MTNNRMTNNRTISVKNDNDLTAGQLLPVTEHALTRSWLSLYFEQHYSGTEGWHRYISSILGQAHPKYLEIFRISERRAEVLS